MGLNKIDNAMAILNREQKRRESLKKRDARYIKEIIFLRKLIRGLTRALALFKIKDNKYPVFLSKKQVEDILINLPDGESLNNFKNQIKVLEEI